MFPKLRTALLAAALAFPSTAAVAKPITLDEAIAKAIDAAPSIRASAAEIAAAQAGRVQAGVRPNPTITVEGENLVGSGPYNVFGQAEITGTSARRSSAAANVTRVSPIQNATSVLPKQRCG